MKKAALALTILATATLGARAGLILSDEFSYDDGPIDSAGSTWIQNTGTAGSMLITNGQLVVSTARTEDIFNTVQGYPYLTNSGVTVYSRYTLKCTFLPTQEGTYLSHFTGTNTFAGLSGHRARVWASRTNANSLAVPGATQFYLAIANNGLGSATNILTPNGAWPNPLETNTTYTIVTRYVVGTGIATLWVDPITHSESDASVTANDPVPLNDAGANGLPTNGPVHISGYSFRQANGEGTMYIDDLKVATNFNDLFNSPNISSIPDQFIPANGSTGPLDFQVGSPLVSATSLTVLTNSSNTSVVPNGNISLTTDGSGSNRTITVTSGATQGSTFITLTVTNGGFSSSTKFKVTVGAPSISKISSQMSFTNTPIPAIPFTVSDAENDSLTVRVVSSSSTNIVQTNNIALGGSGNNRTVTITPLAGHLGATTITLSVADAFNTNSTSFTLTMRPHLGIVYNEDFLYTSWVAGTDQSLLTGSGGSGAPWYHVSGPSGEIQVTNFGSFGLAYLVYTNNEDLGSDFKVANNPFAYEGTNGAVYYSKFTVNCFPVLPSVNGDYFYHLGTNGHDTSSFHDKVFANTKNAATGKFRLGVTDTATANPPQFPADLRSNSTYTVVSRYNSATGESVLWVNPFSESGSPHVFSPDTTGGPNLTGGVALRQPGSSIGMLAIGPIKVSTEWTDVVGTPSPLAIQQTDATHVQLTWPYNFMLQTATDLNGPWSDVTETSPYLTLMDADARFFRLAY